MSQSPNIDHENLPVQEGYKIDVEKIRGNHHKLSPEDGSKMKIARRIFVGNDYSVGYIEGEPGQSYEWHTHVPKDYQIYMPLEGEVEIFYTDNDGEVHSTTAGPMEAVFLPPGAQNRLKVAGDETLKMYCVMTAVNVARVGQLLSEFSDQLYDPHNDPDFALEIDTLRGDVESLDEDVVSEY